MGTVRQPEKKYTLDCIKRIPKPPPMPCKADRKRLENTEEAERVILLWRSALVAWRERSGLPRREVVKGLRVTVQQLANIERGRSNPSQALYRALCKKMGIKAADVFNS